MPFMTSSPSSSRRREPRPVPAPSNPVLLASQSQWLFTDEELTRTPSLLDGMTMEAEHTSRSKGVNFITQVGIMLKLPQLTLATASVYLHRFFVRYSMVDLPHRPGMHPYPIAATSLFLATKVEENCRKMREIVVACCRVAQKNPNLVVDEQSKEFWKWRDTILHNEDLLLEALCFDLQLEQPYRILYDFICFFGVNENKNLRNAAWAFVNDSTFTVLCLQFTPRVIAASALYAAALHCNVAFEDDELGRPWWEQVDVDLTQVRRACNRMAELYENNAIHRQGHRYPMAPVHGGEDTEKTRISFRGSPAGTPSENDANGRKRSREPEGFQNHHESLKPPVSNGTSFDISTSERSPKRQRVERDDSRTAGEGSQSQRPHSSQDTITSKLDVSSSSDLPSRDRDRNDHHNSHNNHDNNHTTTQRQQHPLPPIPPPPVRRNSRDNESDTDPIQQRIDDIVKQNSSGTNQRPSGQDQDRDRDRDRDKGPDGGGGGKSPPASNNRSDLEEGEAIDEEGGGSEEGEI
ncbi:cyclin, putative [Paecilomyces variotii No. 5]|uniref:RNA polymerase II holoenzyme cyclin-like subunit n=1 Tax=Byssochlamys spectabilis (strain No. 5 / NBRC 109023) TaxID=1356009 RepID=V5G1H2_BYSSN|nr:cyclin, putative [Paecilomyces variotii No. 5]